MAVIGVVKKSRGGISFDPKERRTKSDPSVNIHNIIRRYMKTGVVPQMRQGQFGDLGDPPSLLNSLSVISNAESYFSELPSALRLRFKNDFRSFYDFATDPKNLSEMEKMGLVKKVKAGVKPSSSEPAGTPTGSKAPEAPPSSSKKKKVTTTVVEED